MKRSSKRRLDELLVARHLADTVDQARGLIGAGRVLVDEQVADKAGVCFPETAALRIRQAKRFVSRGGEKLAGALDVLDVNPAGWVCADIGAATGGFTDCLVQRGARIVYAVDVAYGMLHWRLRKDARVIVVERTNARDITRQHIDRPLDMAVIDASFISLTKLIPPLLPLFGSTIRIIALIKPQFELCRDAVEPGGVIRNEHLQREAVEAIRRFGDEVGLSCRGIVPSSLKGTKGNQEYLIYFVG